MSVYAQLVNGDVVELAKSTLAALFELEEDGRWVFFDLTTPGTRKHDMVNLDHIVRMWEVES